MSEKFELTVLTRQENSPKGELKNSRKLGQIPAVIYGSEKPMSLWVERKTLEKVLHKAHSTNALVHLTIEDKAYGKKTNQTALLKSIQRDVVYDTPIHIDFLRVSIHQKVEVAVPVHVTGEALGVKNQGGILEHLLREIKVRCLASDIPQAIIVDATPLEIGTSLMVRDLKVAQGVEVLTGPDHVVLNIVVPKAEEVAVPAVEAVTAAEPEVIAKGKKEETLEKEGAPSAGPAKTETPSKKAEAAPKK